MNDQYRRDDQYKEVFEDGRYWAYKYSRPRKFSLRYVCVTCRQAFSKDWVAARHRITHHGDRDRRRAMENIEEL